MEGSSDLVDVAIHENAWLKRMTEEKWHELFERCHALVLPGHKTANVSVCLTNNEEMCGLNTQYRQKDYPTNVLAFPQDSDGILGDIVLAYGTIQEEAVAQGKSFVDHATHLFVHGLLHLDGHDHETQEESQVMEDLEIKILKTLGIGNPYE
jgi:probable rRNA maturation factor